MRLGVERELLNGQTKTMVNLHLNKIEHEYSNITMWAAILTILFLVFSFYSIFKMDELIQQGNEGVKDIRRLKRNGKQEVDSLQARIKEIIAVTKTEIDSFIQDQQKRIDETLKAVTERSNEIERLSNDSLNDYKKKFDTLITQTNTSLNTSEPNKDITSNNINSDNNTDPENDESNGKEEQK